MQTVPIAPAKIEALRGQLTTAVVHTPGSEGYEASLVRWSDTGIKHAGIVVQPVEPSDIATALLWAQEHQVDVAVKGGGHSTAGTSSSDGGLVIDLSRMNRVTVNTAQKTITAQGGSIWKEVDEAGAAHGLATVGGTVNHTGVGGLTLGGGYGWLSGLYGLTIDNLVSARVVLADGRLVNASASENPDLFWGLRGAGYNFGVVVDFTYQAYDQAEQVFCGILGFQSDRLEDVIEQLNATLAAPDPRSGAMCVLALAPDGSGPMIVVICFFNGTREEGEKHFAGLLDLSPFLNTLDMAPYTVMNTLQNPQSTYGDRKSFKGVFYHAPLDTTFVRGIFTDFMAKVESDADLAQSAVILEFFDMRKTCEVALSATAMASRNFTQNGIVYLRWTDETKDMQHREWARTIQSKWKNQLDAQTQTHQSEGEVPQYINYAERKYIPATPQGFFRSLWKDSKVEFKKIDFHSPAGDSVVPNIYGENLKRLQEIKAKYDPGNLFHKMHSITAGSSD